MTDRITKTDSEWREELDAETYRVTRQAGTERPFSHPGFPKGPGHYDCVCCGARLFDGDAKFESHCGWPSFSKPGGDIDEHRDVTEFLEAHGLPEGTAPDLRVAYHSACSLQHGQQIRSAPKSLLAQAGFTVVEPENPHLCCGSAGTYNLLQPELSGELKRRKVATLEAVAPQVIAAGNIGCMMQIGTGTGVPVVHTVELLDWASGGPRPAALTQAPAIPT